MIFLGSAESGGWISSCSAQIFSLERAGGEISDDGRFVGLAGTPRLADRSKQERRDGKIAVRIIGPTSWVTCGRMTEDGRANREGRSVASVGSPLM